jgi:hypothetical protein
MEQQNHLDKLSKTASFARNRNASVKDIMQNEDLDSLFLLLLSVAYT